jgi:hypothetical protein
VTDLVANSQPQRVCVRLWELSGSITGTAEYIEAQRLQNIVALADGYAQKIGVSPSISGKRCIV